MVFDRPPFIAEFNISDSNLSIKEFTLMNVHLRPKVVYNETLGLRTVVDQYLEKSNSSGKNIAIMGDFNFDCSYISAKNRELARSVLSDFAWYISDGVSTTVSASSCALDRIVMNTKLFRDSVVEFSNKTYRYDIEYNLWKNEVKNLIFKDINWN